MNILGNQSHSSPAQDLCANQLFEAQLRQSPDAVAVVFRDEQLSYAELDSRANQLAHYLVNLGVGPDVLVGICAERGIDSLIGILAVLKAGGAFLPLDPEYPADRLAFMLSDAAVTVLLTEDCLVEKISSLDLGVNRPQLVCLDSDQQSIAAEATTAPGELASADNLAYVIYTSGSTGEPKGVQIEHRGLCNMAEAQVQAFALQPGDRVLQFSSLSFDASVFEIFMALRVGATLVIVPPESRVPGPALTRLLREQDISIVTLPPSVLAALTPENLPKLKIITVAGEACSAELVERWAQGRQFYNLYGPTEATVWATLARCVDGSQKPSIGQAIVNTEMYLLDQDLQPVAPGEPGELHIAGVGLARGYLNRPQLNLEKFISNPFPDSQHSRLYRTGDIGRQLPDGNIEFIGRKDDQVKLRGFRIELGEVEATLRSQAQVRDAVVNLMMGASGEQELVAHVVLENPQLHPSAQIPALREFMQQKLPHYMVPAAFVLMQSLPLTIQGKVDRRALPQPSADRSRLSSDYAAPRNDLEQNLAAIWADVLGLEQVGIEDHFLELGGHSLLATRIVTRIREMLGVELSLADFYRELDIAGLATRINQHGPATGRNDVPAICPAPRNDPVPVSFPQEQVIFLTELAPESLAYNAQASIRFTGILDVLALQRALNEIVRRHEIFRTSIDIVDGRPAQRIHPDWEVQLPVKDLLGVAEAQKAARVEEAIDEELRQRFVISECPLVRWKLLKLSAQEHLLIHVEHHLVHDGWSFGVFIHELQVLYRAYSSGRESPLPELPIQFADYAIWQRQWLQGKRLQTLLDYWRQKLAGPLPVLQLPNDYQRPPMQSHRGAEEVIDLSPELSDQLRELGRRENSTLYITALTVFFVLLHKYSDQQDIIVGTGVANRNRREVEGLIGMIINTIALRGDVSGDPTFRELIQRIHDMAFEAFEFQELPFEKLVEALQINRDLTRNPVFQVIFGFHDAQVPALEFPGLHGKIDYLHNGSAKFDLNLVFVPWAEQHNGLDADAEDRRITMKWEYATDLFSPATIRGMTRHYLNLVQQLVRYPDRPLSELSMLGDAERNQLVEDWNQTSTDYPADKTVPGLFEMQVAATPNAIALDYQGETLSYAELNRRANQLAHYLQARGVGAEVKVGLLLERSVDAIVGLLGIVKAGGAYVPLDLDYPESRLAFMLADAEVPVLLTTFNLGQGLPEFAGERVYLDSDRAQIEKESIDNPLSGTTADNLAYVIYTSGSTGTPKGVEIPQRAINRLVVETDYYQVDARDRIAQASNLSFDAATFEVWAALLNGACLVGVNKETFLNSQSLASFLRQKTISAMFITTAVFNQVAREAPGAFAGLKCLMFGGEAVDCAAVRAVLANQPPERLLHVYGPTESTTFASWYRVEAVAADATTVPIGRPLANTTLYVLDQQMNPVPVGVPGELYIGGAGLARGYWRRDALSAQRFVASPFGQGRLYRTGDRVRYRADAAIEFMGRFDDQVKIRGFRIEPGEIEALLCRHSAVQEAAVLVHEIAPGDKRLFAYVVAEPGTEPDVVELRRYVRQQLPDYMLPAAFVVLDEFPLTANGKLDRQALPLPQAMPVEEAADYMPPRSELEQQLMQIWVDVLKLERIGIHDNFFDLGGHSLLATQVVSRIRAQFNIELPLAEMFSCPTLAELAPAIEALLGDSDGEVAEVIPVVDRDDKLPLSFAQERLWFLDQLEPDSIAYNVPLAIRLQGELDVDALTQSLQAIVQRHEVLRTRFAKKQGAPVQIIEAARLELVQADLSTLGSELCEAEVKARIDAEALQPFKLDSGSLLRCHLWRLSNDEHVLMLSMHHVVSDGWSMGVLFRELAALYAAFCRGQPNPLPALALQYADFAVWQRQRLSGERLQAQLDYWKQQLAGIDTLQLPTDRPRPALQTHSGVHRYITLDRELSGRLETLTRQQGATPFMVLLAVFTILLKRYCGQDEIVVGSPIANRNHRGIEDLIGFFVNSLVLRSDLSGDPSFVELLERVKTVALEAYHHQDLPFERLVDELKPQRDRSRNPLFQVMFVVQNALDQSLSLQGLKLERMPIEVKTTHFDLEFHAWQEADQLKLKIAYNTNLFNADTIERVFAHYQTLLTGIVADPNRRISELSMLGDAEQHQLVEDWNQTSTAYPSDKTVHELFEMQAAATPDAIALDCDGATLSYTELNRLANQLAHYLQARGVGPEVMVGLCLERSLEAIVGLLGIVKAGGAYLPLDPDYPESRLAFMLEDTSAPVLLTLSNLEQGFPDFVGERVYLDSDWAQIEKESTDNLLSATTADNLLYVIYTSGSTGRPKGTLIEHRSAVRLVKATNYVDLGTDEVMLQFAPVSFDASTFEIWGSLLNGARLAIFPAGRSALEELGQFIQQRGVTTLWLTSALFSQMVDNHLASLSGVRQLLAGGEALSLGHVKKLLAQLDDGARLINGYGPTENTTFTCCHVMTRDSELDQSVPIGRPISNTSVYILDNQMRPVPIGVPGELYIGGDGLARGYLNQAELTDEKFIADSFSTHADARLYRTGDRVRYRRDGAIEFMGRFDDQVKLRGFRIEPGEIETLLVQHETVRDAALVVHGIDADDKRLHAYVVGEPGTVVDVAELRSHVRQQLPDYMLPAAFMILDEFPVTANGKLDRKALPLPQEMHAEEGSEYMPPRSELEQQLADIWAEVLKLERVSIHDNFFDLGGHSLLATQVVSRIRRQLNLELSLSEMFDYPTVAELAEIMQTLLDEGDGEEADVIPVTDLEGKLPLSFAQERLWFLDQLEPNSSVYNINMALRLKGELHKPALLASLNTIVGCHETLRTRFTMHQGKPVQVVEDATFELAQEDLSELSSQALGPALKARIDEEIFQPFDLSTGPLLRGRLLRLSEYEHVLLLTVHHIVSDGWSLGVLFRQLGECYVAFSAGQQPQLAELPFQYADFAVWQREWLSGERLELQLAYWQQKLDKLATLNLPTDRPRPAVPTYAGAFATMRLDADLSEQLELLGKQAGATLFMTLLGGFSVLMQRYCGQDDIAIGTPIANRSRAETEDLVGLFVNMLVMRTQVHGDLGFADLLTQVQVTALGAYQHQDTPFEKLVEILQPERDRSRNPLFQVQFALQNAPIEPLELQDLTLEPIRGDGHLTRLDLECHVWPRGAELEVIFVYNTDLFEAATIERMLSHYKRLLESVVADPDQVIDSLAMQSEAETDLLLRQWNQTDQDYPQGLTLQQLFEAQVARSPEAIALEYEEQRLSYGELDALANRLARQLQAEGVGPDQLVGVHLLRSLEMVIALCAILKAGGAYVPLDPDYPQDRIAYMATEAELAVLLTQQELQKDLPELDATVICVDLAALSAAAPVESIESAASADDLAYVIYTSGSTGKPKGVMNCHSGIVNRLQWMQQAYALSADDRVLQKTPYSFDVSVWEFFWPLISGARLVIARPEGHKDPVYLSRLIEEKQITTLHFVPSMLKVFLDNSEASEFASVKWVFCSGEALPWELQQQFFSLHRAELHNLYGPTEAAVEVSYWACRADDERQLVPIGHPVANTRLYILDRHMQPVPIGVSGELYIGGVQVARGYLGQPELTAEKFIADPFSDVAGARLYRTGDLARYLSDGAIEYLSRIDNQIKLRGLRIELGEIETVLSNHEAVREAVVLCRDDVVQGQRLVAYLIAGVVEAISIGDIRAYLRTGLPEYMVPSAFVVLEQFPLTASGKLDRKALPDPDAARQSGEDYVEPGTDIERQLAGIWCEVLGVEQVGMHDNFFDLGGHSLMLVELHSRLSEVVNGSLSVVDLLTHSTVGALAEHIIQPGTTTDAAEQHRIADLATGRQRLQQLSQSRKSSLGNSD